VTGVTEPLNDQAGPALAACSGWGAPMCNDLNLSRSYPVTVANRGVGRDLHDRTLATDGTAPPQRQRGSRRNAVATCIGMLHWWHSSCGSECGWNTWIAAEELSDIPHCRVPIPKFAHHPASLNVEEILPDGVLFSQHWEDLILGFVQASMGRFR
jgi:hypothetical protein